MPTDPRIDAYIDRAAPFAHPILTTIRARVHASCPAAEETLKWSMPSFMYKGKILCGMAAFKAHATFGFWQGAAVAGERREEAMGQFGRLSSVEDLPDEAEFAALVAKAAALIDAGVKARPLKHARAAIDMPDDFRDALTDHTKARATFDAFAPSKQRDYLEWVTEAKRPETRAKRIAQAIDWLAEGKARHWKYENC